MGIYKRWDSLETEVRAALVPDRKLDRAVLVRPPLPGNIIVIHGVNDVGVGYGNVEAGLCEGLNDRLWPGTPPNQLPYRAAPWRNYEEQDHSKLEADPDGVFFRRKPDGNTYSPVIPFYWGFREQTSRAKSGEKLPHGQNTDYYGNRLDADFSKEGGAFANATNNLQDMWNKGTGATGGIPDLAMGDPLRPVLAAPGRMYMILAAMRLAALISIIRDYDENEVVSLVAHSQGCMLSLLAQAFLIEKGLRPADTLVLTHPPYSIDEDPLVETSTGGGVDDMLMSELRYRFLASGQTLGARLSTLVNIVKGVQSAKNTTPEITKLKEPRFQGVVGGRWDAGNDRDNRGKVYLYFCPEDATVAFKNVVGMGWQGLPDYIEGHQWRRLNRGNSYHVASPVFDPRSWEKIKVTRQPMNEMKGAFFQRVFTARRRPDPARGAPVLVGQEPHYFAFRMPGEHPFSHLAGVRSLWQDPVDYGGRSQGDLASVPPDEKRTGWRWINGEKLVKPVPADMYSGGLDEDAKPGQPRRAPPGSPRGSYEEVDPVDASIGPTSGNLRRARFWALVDEQDDNQKVRAVHAAMEPPGARPAPQPSPQPAVFAGPVRAAFHMRDVAKALYNAGKATKDQTPVVTAAYECLENGRPTGKLLLEREESSEEARLRLQVSGIATRSFHGAIFGSRVNHRNVTAYDVAIGGGKATSDPGFCEYLCAVADWRIRDTATARPGFLTWRRFEKRYNTYYSAEPEWRKSLIKQTSQYFTGGELPRSLPVVPEGAPKSVIFESKKGVIIAPGVPYPAWYR
ncbi:T6SS effector phospholipase Tle3 domain-containing protein [Eleftheria terrae]|uniref:T6SS effector phospholipase Tle3 domain-containing protein n=1 Tax=Eleftheria terrae TaxID=1597781 RepID=UPI00263AF888|nr:DUF3274 domain-containing protein [Eleftheria terrae]WKB50825.1 DUF3274 domain-containing protein [Eleftheria terrae]